MTQKARSNDRLVIRSAAGAATLTLGEGLPHDAEHTVNSIVATLEFRETFVSLRAGTRIGVGDGEQLVALFDGLARDTGGFVGERIWASRERELELRADHDGSSRLALTVVMRPEYEPPPFTARYTLRIPLDLLASIARDLAVLLRTGARQGLSA